MTREELLQKALEIVEGHRDDDGREDSFAKIAELWTAYLGGRITMAFELSPADVCLMMILLKIARVDCGHNVEDSLVDIAGYAACAVEEV